MDTNKILSSSLLDIVFDSRNKSYGAYELRKSYQQRIATSLGITGALVLIVIVGTAFAGRSKAVYEDPKKKIIVVTEAYVEPEKIIPPEPVRLPEPEPVQTIKLTTIKLVDEPLDEPPPSIADIENAKIDVKTQEGRPDDNLSVPSDLGEGKDIIEGNKNVVPDAPFEKVEIEAQFPGGLEKWRKFLERNCNGQVASDNGAQPGRYTVVVKFIVDENGEVSDIRPQTNLGFGMEQEAIRVIKKATSMKWIPAHQNGRPVKAYRSQPITFEVTE